MLDRAAELGAGGSSLSSSSIGGTMNFHSSGFIFITAATMVIFTIAHTIHRVQEHVHIHIHASMFVYMCVCE